MSGAKAKRPARRPKARYGLTKARRAAIERAKALGRLDPFDATAGHTAAPRRRQVSAS